MAPASLCRAQAHPSLGRPLAPARWRLERQRRVSAKAGAQIGGDFLHPRHLQRPELGPALTSIRSGVDVRLRCLQRRGGRPPRCSGCGYGRTMAARKRPTPEDTVTARRILLDGLARDAGISALVSELVPLHPRNDTFPGEVFLRLASDALDWCGASREQPLTLGGIQ